MIFLVFGVMMLAIPGTAAAASVSVEIGEMSNIRYTAGAAEQNLLRASSDGAVVTVRDTGAQITAGAGCASVNDHKATCDLGGFAPLVATLKGGPDSARVKGGLLLLRADGGGGADRLFGGPLNDRLDGGRGPDVLRGRDGFDAVLYGGRPDDLRVTLGDGKRNEGGPLDGAPRDRLIAIEAVFGGDGHDVLVGDAKPNTLGGDGGRDVIRGGRGGDDLHGGDGRDILRGGKGGDLFPGSQGRDRAYGGQGADHFQGGDPGHAADLHAGGRGHDVMQYGFGNSRVTLDGKANDGECADPACAASEEGDNVKVEELQMGFGDDVLIGSKRDEVFRPSLGADIVRARGGDDTIHVSEDGDPDLYNCGPGEDTIVGTPDVIDQNPNC